MPKRADRSGKSLLGVDCFRVSRTGHLARTPVQLTDVPQRSERTAAVTMVLHAVRHASVLRLAAPIITSYLLAFGVILTLAEGLALGVASSDQRLSLLAMCDTPRQVMRDSGGFRSLQTCSLGSGTRETGPSLRELRASCWPHLVS
jgi:hypothetical protein